jgi:hypothetical protein
MELKSSRRSSKKLSLPVSVLSTKLRDRRQLTFTRALNTNVFIFQRKKSYFDIIKRLIKNKADHLTVFDEWNEEKEMWR